MNFVIIVQASWETLSFAFQFALINGGPASMVYGGIFAIFGGTAVAASLAEMASMFVFSNMYFHADNSSSFFSDAAVGAQYRWSANFAPAAPRFWGLIQG